MTMTMRARTMFALTAAMMMAAWPGTGAAQQPKPIGGGIGYNTPVDGEPNPYMPDVASVATTSGCPEAPQQFYPCATAKAKGFTPPRHPDGTPNLEGFWGRNIGAGLGAFSGRNSAVVDPPGDAPYQPWALALLKGLPREFVDPVARCMPQGVPRFNIAPSAWRIIQSPGYVTFVGEQLHTFRIVPTDNRPHPGPGIRFWMGDAVGRWEGNTLVIDTTNFNGLAVFNVNMDFASDALHVVERYTLIDKDNMLYEARLEDPSVFTRPFTIAWGRTRDPRSDKGVEILEEACYEGNWRWLDGELAAGRKIMTAPLRKP